MKELKIYSDTLDRCINDSDIYKKQDELNLLLLLDQIKLYLMDREVVLSDAKEFKKGSRILVKSSNGTMVAKQSPNFVSMQQSLNQIKLLITDLGLSPKSRNQIIKEIQENDKTLDELKEIMSKNED